MRPLSTTTASTTHPSVTLPSAIATAADARSTQISGLSIWRQEDSQRAVATDALEDVGSVSAKALVRLRRRQAGRAAISAANVFRPRRAHTRASRPIPGVVGS